VADWDADSPRLRQNLTQVLLDIRDSALRRDVPSLDAARQWQSDTMAGLEVAQPETIGRFRGERGVRTERVAVGSIEAVRPGDVAGQLAQFERRLQRAVATLDERYPAGHELEADGLAAVLDLCAWAHSEWVRIHPFANGNGRTARMWANFLLMRYGLPPVVRLRPRPDAGYGAAAGKAMGGDWKPTAAVFRKMLLDLSPPSRRS
jgi:hypothetical protein